MKIWKGKSVSEKFDSGVVVWRRLATDYIMSDLRTPAVMTQQRVWVPSLT